MKVILLSINAKYIHTNNAVRLLKANTDFLVDIMEYTIKDDIEKIVHDIENINPDVLGFSVQMSSGAFSMYSNHDLAKRQEEVDKLASEAQTLQDELDLADNQDKILEYIYDGQYTDVYDKIYDIDSDFYMGEVFA